MSPPHRLRLAAGVPLFVAALAGARAPPLEPVEASRLRAEWGQFEAGGSVARVRTPGFRAVLPGASGAAARIAFTYLGPTAGTAPLRSGELRRQIGLKLQAEDTCNLLYVMWHVAPTAGLLVQTKVNPGLHANQECRDGGYASARATFARPVDALRPGTRHSLEARIDGASLRVWADDVLAWEGTLGRDALALSGTVGVRTDNGEFDLELWAAPR